MAENKEKLVITAFKQVNDAANPTGEFGKFEVMFNPQMLNFKREVEYEFVGSDPQKTLNFKTSKPSSYDFEFIFDGTGTSGNKLYIEVDSVILSGDGPDEYLKKDENNRLAPIKDEVIPGYLGNKDGLYDARARFVSKAVELFEKLTVGYVRDTHMAPILKLNWGPLDVQVIMKTIDVTYDLFNKYGGPLRARVKCNFVEFTTVSDLQASLKPASPDMTHKRIALDGETLPLMTKRIYGDPKYYLEIARINNLSDFRKLKAGQELIFPPIDKLN